MIILTLSISILLSLFFFSSRRRHTRFKCDWSSDVCSSDLIFRSLLVHSIMRIRERWRGIRDWWGRTWANLRPGPEARTGAVWGALAVAIFIAGLGGTYLQSGFGLGIGIAFALLVAALGVALVMLLLWLLLTILPKLPRWFSRFLIRVFPA